MRLRTLLLLPLLIAPALVAQSADPGLRTVRQANSLPTGYPPRGGSWSPDSRLYTFVANDDKVAGSPGDIVAIEAATGRAFVLASAAQLAALPAPAISEKDADHRNRYSMSAYLWADDSKHLVIDNGGPIYLWDIADSKRHPPRRHPQRLRRRSQILSQREIRLLPPRPQSLRPFRRRQPGNPVDDRPRNHPERRSRLGLSRRARGPQQLLLVARFHPPRLPADGREQGPAIPH